MWLHGPPHQHGSSEWIQNIQEGREQLVTETVIVITIVGIPTTHDHSIDLKLDPVDNE